MIQDPPYLAPYGMLLKMEKRRVVLYAGTWPRSLGYPKPYDS